MPISEVVNYFSYEGQLNSLKITVKELLNKKNQLQTVTVGYLEKLLSSIEECEDNNNINNENNNKNNIIQNINNIDNIENNNENLINLNKNLDNQEGNEEEINNNNINNEELYEDVEQND